MFDGAGMLDLESEVFLFLYSLLVQQRTLVLPFHITRRSETIYDAYFPFGVLVDILRRERAMK
jgi:hypothetical protein